MMIDEIYDRNYQAARRQMNRDIDGLIQRVANSLGNGWTILNRIQFDAPWKARPQPKRRSPRSRRAMPTCA